MTDNTPANDTGGSTPGTDWYLDNLPVIGPITLNVTSTDDEDVVMLDFYEDTTRITGLPFDVADAAETGINCNMIWHIAGMIRATMAYRPDDEDDLPVEFIEEMISCLAHLMDKVGLAATAIREGL